MSVCYYCFPLGDPAFGFDIPKSTRCRCLHKANSACRSSQKLINQTHRDHMACNGILSGRRSQSITEEGIQHTLSLAEHREIGCKTWRSVPSYLSMRGIHQQQGLKRASETSAHSHVAPQVSASIHLCLPCLYQSAMRFAIRFAVHQSRLVS